MSDTQRCEPAVSDLPPCACGGYPNERGGLASSRHWVECCVCGASTGLHGYFGARAAWRARQLRKPATPITPASVVAALVEALERIVEGDHPEGTSLAVNGNYRELSARLQAVAVSALAAYRRQA